MRFHFTLFIFTFSTLIYGQVSKIVNDPFVNAQKKIPVTGQIKNYVPDNDNRFIRFRTYDISGRSKDSAVFINKSGNFNTILSQPFEGDISMMFDEKFVTLYGIPGEKIGLEIDAVKLKSEENKSKAITITGKSASVSKLIMQFKLPKQDGIPADENWNDSTLSDQTIAKARAKRMKNEIDFLNQWMKKNGVTNKTFSNWARNNIIYNAGLDITGNLYMSKRRTATDQQLMEFTTEIPLDNPTALNNSAYYLYLQSMAMNIQFIVNGNPQYDSIRKLMGKNAIPIYLQKIDQYTKGFAKQMMYYTTFNSNRAEKTEPYAESFDSVITIPCLQNLIAARKNNKPFQPYSIIEKLKEYKIDDSLKSRLISIFESSKKNLFIDFWGDWCAPCMREMPHFPKLVNMFKGSELDFLFFAVETSEQKAIEIKNKYGIDAVFIVLSNNEVRIMNNVLGFSSYPSHFIIGAGGMVKENFGMHIDSGNELSNVAVDRLKKYSAL